MEDDYVSLGDVCRNQLGMQCQYGSRYADPIWSTDDRPWPYCGEGLRIKGTSAQYHSMTIHKDDVNSFVERVQAIRSKH